MFLTALLVTTLLSAAPAPATPAEPDPLQGYPAWARALGERYLLGQTSVFILHGNVHDLQGVPEEGGRRSYPMLREFLARDLFGSRDLVLFYDPVEGIRAAQAQTAEDLQKALGEKLKGLTTLPQAPEQALPWLHDYLHRRAAAGRSVALILPDADAVVPAGELATLSAADRQAVVMVRNWATQAALVNADVSVVLVTGRLQDVASALTREPRVGVYELPRPSAQERLDFLRESLSDPALADLVRVPAQRLVELTEGALLRELDTMLALAFSNRTPVTEQSLAQLRSKPAAAPAAGAPAAPKAPAAGVSGKAALPRTLLRLGAPPTIDAAIRELQALRVDAAPEEKALIDRWIASLREHAVLEGKSESELFSITRRSSQLMVDTGRFALTDPETQFLTAHHLWTMGRTFRDTELEPELRAMTSQWIDQFLRAFPNAGKAHLMRALFLADVAPRSPEALQAARRCLELEPALEECARAVAFLEKLHRDRAPGGQASPP